MPRVGKKRSDRRWTDEEGNVWASKFESQVYHTLAADPRLTVRRCDKGSGDSFAYQTPVIGGSCLECGSGQAVQRRTYTPDIFVVPHRSKAAGAKQDGYYIEAKGYFSPSKRNLLRSFRKTGPPIDLRIVLQRDLKATKNLRLSEYIEKYLKLPWHVWDGGLPDKWIKNK